MSILRELACSGENMLYLLADLISTERKKNNEPPRSESIKCAQMKPKLAPTPRPPSGGGGDSARWRNWATRVLFGGIMIFGFAGVIYLGPLAIGFLNVLVQLKCFSEIFRLGVKFCDCACFKTSQVLCWYLLLASDYFFMGEVLIEKQPYLFAANWFLIALAKFHRFISFVLYSGGMAAYAFSLDSRKLSNQLTLLAYTHLAILIASELSDAMRNAFEGIIWFLLPVSLIIFNDIMAYMFGFFFGRTQLIELSPKKTWEGFVGSAVTTVLFGFLISALLCENDYFTRPVLEPRSSSSSSSALFEKTKYVLMSSGPVRLSFDVRPFYKHALVFSLFISLIGPFGGFFASGFKRAFQIKDFGNSIPGHGGFTDRFDCIALVIAFVSAYLKAFIRSPKPGQLFAQFLLLDASEQQQLLDLINSSSSPALDQP